MINLEEFMLRKLEGITPEEATKEGMWISPVVVQQWIEEYSAIHFRELISFLEVIVTLKTYSVVNSPSPQESLKIIAERVGQAELINHLKEYVSKRFVIETSNKDVSTEEIINMIARVYRASKN